MSADMKTVYERIAAVKPGETIYCDYHDTLFFVGTQQVNAPLVNALIEASARGVLIELWTGDRFNNTVGIVSYMKTLGLIFNNVHCGIEKPSLLIDDLAANPKY